MRKHHIASPFVALSVVLGLSAPASSAVVMSFGKTNDSDGFLTIALSGTIDFDVYEDPIRALGSSTSPVISQDGNGPIALMGQSNLSAEIRVLSLASGEFFPFYDPAPLGRQTSHTGQAGGIFGAGGFAVDGGLFGAGTTGVQSIVGSAIYDIAFDSVGFGNGFFGAYTLNGGELLTLVDATSITPTTPVPLPASLVLMLGGLGALAFFRGARKA